MTNAAELISKMPTKDLAVLTREPDPLQTGQEQREEQLKAVTGVADKLSQAITAPISETRTPRRFKFTIPQISKALKTMSQFSETHTANQPDEKKPDALIPLRAQSMLREALLAEWIMQREKVMFDSQYRGNVCVQVPFDESSRFHRVQPGGLEQEHREPRH